MPGYDLKVTRPGNHCFFYSAVLALLYPNLTLMRGGHTGMSKEDTAHFYVQDEDGEITDPTAAQYPTGHLIEGDPVSAIANIDYVIKNPLFKTLPEEYQKRIISIMRNNITTAANNFCNIIR